MAIALHKSNPGLWLALADLPLDRLPEDPGPHTAFVRRLMRERRWSYTLAVRCIAEYRRFLYLASLGEASPSPSIDAVWHEHLLFTRAYRIGLCERILGRPLDHDPATGPEDAAHNTALYEATRRRYEKEFAEAPPPDIWPAPRPAARPVAKGGPSFIGVVIFVTAFLLVLPALSRLPGPVALMAMMMVGIFGMTGLFGRRVGASTSVGFGSADGSDGDSDSGCSSGCSGCGGGGD